MTKFVPCQPETWIRLMHIFQNGTPCQSEICFQDGTCFRTARNIRFEHWGDDWVARQRQLRACAHRGVSEGGCAPLRSWKIFEFWKLNGAIWWILLGNILIKVFWSSGRPLLCFSRFWLFENVARIRCVYVAYSRTKKCAHAKPCVKRKE